MQRAELEAFAAALRDGRVPIPGGLAAPEGAPVADRFAVYRNNVHASLVDVLVDRFPVVQALVGVEFFRAMARAYVRGQRPRDASLFRYGGSFPAFVAGFEPARGLPYLPDVARVENAWHESWGAADTVALALGDLIAVPPEQLVLASFCAHPAARLLRSPWPVGSLWLAHQATEPDLAALEWRPQSVLITRPQAAICVQCLPAGAAALAAGLLEGATLDQAFSAALDEDAGTDAREALRTLTDAGAFRAIFVSGAER